MPQKRAFGLHPNLNRPWQSNIASTPYGAAIVTLVPWPLGSCRRRRCTLLILLSQKERIVTRSGPVRDNIGTTWICLTFVLAFFVASLLPGVANDAQSNKISVSLPHKSFKICMYFCNPTQKFWPVFSTSGLQNPLKLCYGTCNEGCKNTM